MNRDINHIISENKKRNAVLDAFYDPIRGIGSLLERFKIVIKETGELFLPMSMQDEPLVVLLQKQGSFERAASVSGREAGELLEDFFNVRFKHDFEFWAFTCIFIENKDAFEEYPFKLRGAQRTCLFDLEMQRLAGVPIRIVLLKARQWGGSTLVQIYMMWIQQVHKENWHSVVVAQDDTTAGVIASMYDYARDKYPLPIGTLKPFKGSTKIRQDSIRKHRINIGSVNRPEQFRGKNNAMIHMSECGIWQDTLKIKVTNLISSLKETVPDQPLTLIVEESTAKGLNYFYDSWRKAVSGKTRYKAVFIPWWQIDRDRVPLTMPIEEFIKSFDDYHWFLWELGATLEGIYWYMLHKADKNYQDWEMQNENPSTPEEAFQTSGQRVFPPVYIEAIRKDCCKPLFRGDVFGDARAGSKAIDNVRIEKINRGNLQVWKTPEQVLSQRVKNRICAFVDIGGTTRVADFSIIKLIDREPMIYGNDPEVICQWSGHIDQDLLAWKAAQICIAYSQPEIGEYPLLAFEIQSLDKKGTEGNHSLTILDNLKDYYPNLYIRNDEEKVGDDFVPKYGAHTNTKTKGLWISTTKAAMRERYMGLTDQQDNWGYIERDEETCNEYSWYEVKENGSLGAIDGKHDDRVMATAGCVWMAISKMDLPYVVKEGPKVKVKTKRGYASF
jgi:hypothetical protein